MDIEKENIIGYIDYESNVPKKDTLLSSIIMMLMVSIPSAFFGKYFEFTRIIMVPVILFFSIWAVYILINVSNKRNQFVLFLGWFSLFISGSFMLAAYKFASTTMFVSWGYLTTMLGMYIGVNFLNIWNVIRLIKKGYYKQKDKTENSIVIIFAMAILGLGIGKAMVGNIEQDKVVTIIVSLMIFMALLYSVGTHNLLKYYYIKRLKL